MRCVRATAGCQPGSWRCGLCRKVINGTLPRKDASGTMIGSTLGHYRIVERIGAGGMGEVYRAHDEKLERDVALKVLPSGMLADEAARRRFRKEALALAKLNHPNVETIYEFASQDGVDFLAMELVAGITLGQKLTGGPLSDKEVLQLGSQIVEGLNAAHEKGIVHCDLKPANVMVSSSGCAKVLDFGLAKFFHIANDASITESVTELSAAGTLPYMSPEQVRGERVDVRSDIYGAGTLLYEMGTGQRPFPETNAPRLIDDILHHEPKCPSAINRRLVSGFDTVVLKSLDKQPERRYQSARELAVDLGRLSTPMLPVAPAGSLKKRNPWLFAVPAAVLIALIVLAVPSTRHFLFRHKTEAVAHPPSPNFTGGKRLAVFPFEVEGDRASLAYIADGLVESLQIRLSQLSALNVAPSEVVSRADLGQPFDKIGRALGINLVSRGLVRDTPQGLQIELKLQNTSDAQPFWTHEFSAKRLDLVTVQDEMYERLLSALAVHETEDERFRALMRPVVSGNAYDLYLKGRERMSERQGVPDPNEAIHFYEASLKQQHDFDLAYIGVADANLVLYEQEKDSLFSRRAVKAAQQAVQLNNSSPITHYTLAKAYAATSRYQEAVEELRKVVVILPNSDEAYRRLGSAYMNSGQAKQGIEAFQKVVELNPYFWQNQNLLGDAYLQTADYPRAVEAFKQVTVLEPDIDAGYENIGNVYLTQGKYEESIPYFQKALQIEPYFSTYSNLGTAYFFLKQYANAVEMFEKAVAMSRANTAMMVNMADAYRYLGRQDRARAAYQQAIHIGHNELEKHPKDAEVMAQVALSYAKIGNVGQARALIKQVRGIQPTDVNYIYDEAVIAALCSDKDKALNLVREALEKHYPAEFIGDDPELGSLRDTPEFKSLIQKYSVKPTTPASLTP